MFSVVVAGRLPLPAPQQIDATHAVFALSDASSINHVVVFMTGAQPFPPGFGATVHLNWKAADGGQDRWVMLGCLKNEKPSSIFRIKGLTQQQGQVAVATSEAAIGISIEALDSVDQQMASLGNAKTSVGDDSMQADASSNALALVPRGAQAPMDASAQTAMALAMAPKIANNIFSFLSSFAPDSAPQTVPLLKRWLEQFERKLKAQGVAFLAKSDAD